MFCCAFRDKKKKHSQGGITTTRFPSGPQVAATIANNKPSTLQVLHEGTTALSHRNRRTQRYDAPPSSSIQTPVARPSKESLVSPIESSPTASSGAGRYEHWTKFNSPLRAQELEAGPSVPIKQTTEPPVRQLSSPAVVSEGKVLQGDAEGTVLPTMSNEEPVSDVNTDLWLGHLQNGETPQARVGERAQYFQREAPMHSVSRHIMLTSHSEAGPAVNANNTGLETSPQEVLNALGAMSRRPGRCWISQNKNSRLKRDVIGRLQADIRGQDSQIKELEYQNSGLRQDRENLMQVVRDERNKLQQNRGVIQQLMSEKQSLDNSIVRWEHKYSTVLDHNRAMEAETRGFHQQIARVDAENKGLHKQMARLDAEAQDREQRWKHVMHTRTAQLIHDHKVDREAWQVEKDTLVATYDQAKQKIQAEHQGALSRLAEAHVDEKADIEKRHAAEYRSLRSEITSYKRQLAAYNSNGSYVAIPDQDFSVSFQKLAQRVNNLVALLPTSIQK